MTGAQEPFVAHSDHEWAQVGRGVYCVLCKVLLYHGRIPTTSPQRGELMVWLDGVAAEARERSEGDDGGVHQGGHGPDA